MFLDQRRIDTPERVVAGSILVRVTQTDTVAAAVRSCNSRSLLVADRIPRSVEATRNRIAGFLRRSTLAYSLAAADSSGRSRALGSIAVPHCHCRIRHLLVQPSVVDFAAGRSRRFGR